MVKAWDDIALEGIEWFGETNVALPMRYGVSGEYCACCTLAYWGGTDFNDCVNRATDAVVEKEIALIREASKIIACLELMC